MLTATTNGFSTNSSLTKGSLLKLRVKVHYQDGSWSASGGTWIDFDCLLGVKRRGGACTLDLAESVGPLPMMQEREKRQLGKAMRDVLIEALGSNMTLLPFYCDVIGEGRDL